MAAVLGLRARHSGAARRFVCRVAYGASTRTATEPLPSARVDTGGTQAGDVMDGPLPRSIDTVVIGAGQAGLLMSWHLQQAGRDHVVLDRREILSLIHI